MNAGKQAGSSCDESKCVSRGRSHLFEDSFTCYGDEDGRFYPMMCADGFLPVIVEDQPSYIVENEKGATLSYFTCCPPSLIFSKATRHCSDPITRPIGNESENGAFPYDICHDQGAHQNSRLMKNSESSSNSSSSFVCCDSFPRVATYDDDDENDYDYNSTANIELLDSLECVPYRDDFYDPARSNNRIGELDVIMCNVQEGDFLFARPNGKDDVASTGRYQCCKTGPNLPPFAQDSIFKISIYPTTILFFVAAILSVIVILGLSIPLLFEIFNKTRGRKMSSINFERSRFSIDRSSQSIKEKNHQRPESYAATRGTLKYSSYNLYLVYLALLDLGYASYMIWLNLSYINQTFDPNLRSTPIVTIWSFPFGTLVLEDPVMLPYMSANIWINALIAHEVLVLLRTSFRRQKINQPSRTKVNLQAGGVCLIHGVAAFVAYYAIESAWKKRYEDDFARLEKVLSRFRPMFTILLFGPFLYVVYATTVIWWRGYIPPPQALTSRNKAMRELAFYFFRIVAVFFGVWVPAVFFFAYAELSGRKWGVVVAQCLTALQPTLTTCLILTKSDAKRYILDLVTLSYIFGDSCCNRFSHEIEKRRTSSNRSADADPIESTDEGAIHDEEADSLIFSVLGSRFGFEKT